MSSFTIGLICIGILLALLALKAPIALAMAAVGFIGFAWIIGFEPALGLLDSGPFETLSNYSFSPIPMFILMGVFASKSNMSQQLFTGARAMFGAWRGGMSLATLLSCGIFSAISGSSVATAASMSRVALPEMKRHGYADSLSAGTLAAGGSLGIMIPPSIALMLYALITEQSVGDMFIAGIIPGLLGLLLYGITIALLVQFIPSLATRGEPTTLMQKVAGLKGMVPFLGVFLLIIVGIYTGLFTPTEAAAVGAFATMVIALVRGMTFSDFRDCLYETLVTTVMIFFMIIGAEIFGYFLSVSRISFELVRFVDGLNLTPFMVLMFLLVLFIVLGCVMDSLAMLLLTIPVVYPLVISAGFDPIWFGIIAVIAVELGLITPPVGMIVFVIKAFAPSMSLSSIYRGVIPFLMADMVRLALIIAFPVLVVGLL